ncbi:MAG: tetratricopeptide repeat protein [Planctomycetota bacterium]|nr:tetratricopeptide repeat protein [Planctomycetota bacterium]
MKSRIQHFTPLVLVFFLTTAVLADGEGQADYDKAIVAKLKAKTAKDFDDVIDLCESAIEKGLDDQTAKLARDLIKNTLNEICVRLSDEVFELAKSGQQTWRFKRRQALVRFEKLIELDPKNGDAYYRTAQLQLMAGGDREKAKEAINEAVKTGSLNQQDATKALILKGMLSDNEKDREKAFDDAIAKDPGNIQNIRMRAGYYFEKKNYARAETDFRKLVELKPDDNDFKQALVDTLLNQSKEKKTRDALSFLDAMIKDDDSNLDLYISRARVHGTLQQTDKEIADLTHVIEKDDRNILALLMRGWAYLGDDKIDKAKQDMEGIFKINKYNLQGTLLQAQIAAQEDDYDLAIKNLENVVRAVPAQARNYYKLQLALYYRGAKRFNKALNVYEEVLKGEPGNVGAIVARADTVLGMGKHEQAMADYETSMDLELSNRQKEHVWNNLAWMLATSPKEELRDGKRAVELATKAAEITEYKAAYILSTLASGYAEDGDFESAVKWSSKAVELAKKSPSRDSQVEDLQKELESYKKKKPWRELQEEKDKSGDKKKKSDNDFDF